MNDLAERMKVYPWTKFSPEVICNALEEFKKMFQEEKTCIVTREIWKEYEKIKYNNDEEFFVNYKSSEIKSAEYRHNICYEGYFSIKFNNTQPPTSVVSIEMGEKSVIDAIISIFDNASQMCQILKPSESPEESVEAGMIEEGKAYQKTRLTMEFGILIQPYDELLKEEAAPALEKYRIANAKVESDYSKFRDEIYKFAKFRNITFYTEGQEIERVILDFIFEIKKLIFRQTEQPNLEELHNQLKEKFEIMISDFVKKVDLIPIRFEMKLFDANTQFTTYMAIKDHIDNARQRIDYFDRYLKEDFFSKYLRSLDRSISIRLITTRGNNNYGVSNIKNISDLFKKEFKNYKLIELDPKDFHFRQLRIDDKIFLIDQGIDQAGQLPTTFGITENTLAAHKILDDLIIKGRVVQ